MNKEIVKSEQVLAKQARSLLEESTFAKIRVRECPGSEHVRLVVCIASGGVEHEFLADCRLRPSARDVTCLSSQKLPGKQEPLLVTVLLTSALVEECRKQGVACLDLNGRLWISAKGLVIDRNVAPRATRYVLAEPPVNFFSMKSSRVARVLLSFPDRTWKQADLAGFTQLSKGLISRLLKYATHQGWVEDKRRAWRLTEPDSLLTAWEDADRLGKRVSIRQYSTLESDFRVLAQRLLQGLTGDLAFTQWFAASLRHPYTVPPVLSVYRRQFPSNEDLDRLDLREVDDGGKIWVLAPRDPGVFQIVRRIQGYPLVCDAQIYLDLIRAGLRGDDQAKALRKWSGFGRS